MKIMRMTFDIAVSDSETSDVYTIEKKIARAISGASCIVGCEGVRENSMRVNSLDVSKVLDDQKRLGKTLEEWVKK